MSDRPTMLVIDGHALAFRAFHALREAGLRASTGEPTYAVFGFLSIMLNAIDERHPEYLAVSFDIGRTFRDDMYADYKAGRVETPQEFHPQLERIQQVIRALNIPIYTAEGFEADDVIGTIARQASAQDVATIVLTGDTDTLQLVDDHVQVLLANPYAKGGKNTTLYDHAAVVERYKGLQPNQLADLRGLKGDTSDNIPGVKGIGEAGAIALLLQFGTVENLYDHFDQVPNRYKKPLDGQREIAIFSKTLATIVCDAPATLDLPHARLGDYDRTAVIALFQEMEMGATLIKKLPVTGQAVETVELPEARPAPTPAATPAPDNQDSLFSLPASLPEPGNQPNGPQQLAMFDLGAAEAGRAAPLVDLPAALVEPNTALGSYRAITTEDELSDLISELAAAPAFAFDTETDGLRPFDSRLVGISVATRPGSAVYLPFGHTTGEPQLDAARVLQALKPFLSDPRKPKYAHNAKFDIEVLLHAGLQVEGLTFDTMLAAALLDKRKGLKDLSFYELRLPEPMTAIEDLIGKGKNQITFAQVPLATATPYAAADADMTLRLVEALRPQLEALPKVNDIFMRLEMPLLPVLVRMEAAGIGIDVPYMRALGQRLGARLSQLEQQIYAYNGGMPFNIGSGQQLTEILFTKLGLDPSGLEKTKTGQFSLTAQAMELLRDRHPEEAGYQIIDLILQHRQLTKLKSTYIDALPELVDQDDGRIHTSYSQLGAATGRLSCLPAETLLNTQRGLVGIETVRPGDTVRTCLGPYRVLAWQQTGVKPVIALRLSNGIILRCSPEHRIRSGNSWLEAENVKVGDPVYMSFAEGIFGTQTQFHSNYTSHYDTRKTPALPREWTPELAELIGYHIADGHIARSNYNNKPAKIILAFGWQDDDLIEHFSSIIHDLFQKKPVHRITKSCPVLEICGVDIGGMFEQLGAGGKSHDIRVPPSLFTAPEEIVAGFLRGYFEGDGYAGPDGGIFVRSVCRRMLEDVQQLLTLFGVPSTIKTGTADPRGYAPGYTLRLLGDRSKAVFAKRIGFLSHKKQQACEALAANSKVRSASELLSLPSNFDIDGLKPAMYAAHRQADGRTTATVQVFASKLKHRTKAITLPRAEWLVQTLPESLATASSSFLREAVDGQYYEVQVVEATHEPPVPMFDIAVENVEQYMAQGIVVHNSTDPNLQNIPTRTDEGREIRRGFVAKPGHQFVAADYSQIELRVLAHITGDENLVATFNEGRDIHAATASQLFGVAQDKVDKNQRRVAKTIVFGVIYGISSFGLAPRIGASRSEAQAMIDALFARFPKIRAYIDQTLAEGRQNGYVQSLFGRRRTMAELKTGGPRRQAAEREAINAPIQATAADIMKIAMIRVDEALRRENLQTRLLLQVHDELILEAPDHELAQAAALVKREMEGAFTLHVPLGVDVEAGPNWLEMRDIDTSAADHR